MFLGGEYGRGEPASHRVNPGINTFYDTVNQEEAERQARIRKELAQVSTETTSRQRPSRAELEAEKHKSAPRGPMFPFDRPSFQHSHTVPSSTNAIVNSQYAQNKLDLMKRRAEYAKMIEEQLKERNENQESEAKQHQHEIQQALESDYWNKPQPVIVTRRDRGNPTLRFDPITHNLQAPAPTNHRREHPVRTIFLGGFLHLFLLITRYPFVHLSFSRMNLNQKPLNHQMMVVSIPTLVLMVDKTMCQDILL